jgi:pimeloyl-ACP methyl ester carboxylesterase
MHIAKKLLCAGFVSVLTLAVLAVAPAQAQGSFGQEFSVKTHVSGKGRCASFNAPVASAPGRPRSWKVALIYCQPFKWAKGTHQVDVLTHGATYNHTYWDWEQNPSLYSYVGKTLADGRAILNYDRIGNGTSTRPASSTEITMATDAYVLHQLIQGLKLLGYSRINSISHSYGGGVALAEAAAYADVSNVVVTGYLHRPSNPAVTAGNYPANQDPKFAAAELDSGYFTSRVGVRGTSFHSPSSDPAVIAYDEDHKDLVSLTGLLDFLGQRGVPAATNISNKIHVPVLVVNGQQDAIFCYDPTAFNCASSPVVTGNEAPYYAGSPTFKVVTIPNSGHDLTLHPTANDSYGVISQWLKTN